MPLDVFDSHLADARHIRKLDSGEGEDMGEKFDRLARERLTAKFATCDWWA